MAKTAITEAKVEIGLVDRLTAPIKKIARALDRLKSPFNRLKRSFGEISRAARFDRIAAGLERVRSRALLASAAVAGIGIAGLASAKSMISAFAKNGDALAKLARDTGVSVEAIQGFRFAGDRAGVAPSMVDNSFKQLQVRWAELRDGRGTLHSGLKDANPELLKRLNDARSMDEAFGIILSTMETMDKASAALLAKNAFGRANQDMVRLAFQGAETNRQLFDYLRENGGMISKKDAENAEAFTDAITNLQYAWTGVKNAIAGNLMPQLLTLIEDLTKASKDNRERIGQWAEDFGKSIPGMIEDVKSFVAGFKQGLAEFKRAIEPFTGEISNLKIALGTVAAIIFGPLAAAFAGLAGALVYSSAIIGGGLVSALSKLIGPIGKVFKWVWRLTTPFRIVFTVLVLVIAEIIAEWDKFATYWKQAWSNIKAAFDEGFFTAYAEVVKTVYKALMDGVDHLTEKYLGFSLSEFVGNVLASIAGIGAEIYRQGLDFGAKLISGFTDGITGKMKDLRDALAGLFGEDVKVGPAPGGHTSRRARAAALTNPGNDNPSKLARTIAETAKPPTQTINAPAEIHVTVTPPPNASPDAVGEAVAGAVGRRWRREQQRRAAELRD